jgi:prephenate dehydrogenase
VLGLSHFVNLVFASTLARAGVERAELYRVGSTTFQAQIATARSVVGEDAELYFGIQKLNRFSPEVWHGFLREAGELVTAVERSDLDAFASAMAVAREWLAAAPASAAG